MKNLIATSLLAGTVFLGGCQKDFGDIPKDIVEFSENRVFLLKPETANGNGSAIRLTNDIMISACHVTDKHERMVARNSKQLEFLVKRLVCDKEHDISILQIVDIDRNEVESVPLEEFTPNTGDLIYGPGHPLGMPLMITHGHWQRLIIDSGKGRAYMITSPTVNGDSGSPVLIYDEGKVKLVGIRVAVRAMPAYGGFGGMQIGIPVTHLALVIPSDVVQHVLIENAKILE